MLITVKDGSLTGVSNALWSEIRDSRFTVKSIDFIGVTVLKIRQVRLRESKPYCGNHPAECENNFGKPRRGNWLEGLDWVEFNDLVNDVLDRLDVSANVRTTVCNIRKGRLRRINYDYHREGVGNFGAGFAQWDRQGDPCDYEDWCGKVAPASQYPYGTPGIYSRKGLATHNVG